MNEYGVCQEAVDLLSTETCVTLARGWQKRQGWSSTHSMEYMAAQALWDILFGRHVQELIREEVEEALEAVRVARAMRGEPWIRRE